MKLIIVILFGFLWDNINCFDNICRGNSTTLSLSSTYINLFATLANDGNFDTTASYCSHTDINKDIAWFQVDFGKLYSIANVKIYYRKEGDDGMQPIRFRQFYLDVSNSSATQSSTIQRVRCYTDKTTAPDVPRNILDIPCKHTARYVIVETTYDAPDDGLYTGAMLEICEIEVYGCESGKYGENCMPCQGCETCDINSGQCEECTDGRHGHNCTIICGHCVNGKPCQRETGVCDLGCDPGYQTLHCIEACSGGVYGQNCSLPCGQCLDNEQCHHINGTCMNGCGRGYQGLNCTEVCTAGYYGEHCISICGHCLNNSACDHITGVCEQGCESGFQRENCTEVCTGGMYGSNCSVICGNCFESQQCHHINGTCMNGCSRGYQGVHCTEECKANFFGENCEKRCNSTCKNCNKTSGECENGCYPGWSGRFCQEVCTAGFYGENCSSICGHCLNNSVCDHVTGVCKQGCEPGYQGENCTEVCLGGMYGSNCRVTCGNCFESKQCHYINGTCMNGCGRGYQGVHCTEECDDYFFGENCEKRCNSTCRNCNKSSGECEYGCYPGWTGRFCQEECTAGYYGGLCSSICGHCLNNSTCDHITGVCEQGCEPGYQGEICTEACNGGMYGTNCSVTCGNCFESQQCHHINGTCMDGCDDRYQGLKCIEEILQILQFKSNSLELREGKPAWFELQVLSHSDFKVEWFHDGYMITTSRARFIITSTDMRNATSFHTLQIDRVMQRDTGEWKITVSNEVTYVTRKVTVTVIPELVIKMNPQFDFSVPSGDNIYLQCTVSNPESLYHVTNGRIVFMKNGSLLSVGESYTNFSTIWRKLSATGNDSGRYTCVHSGYDYPVSVSVYINVIQPQQKGCKSEQSDGIIWNTTLAGTTKKEPCPENQIGFVTRYCNSDGIWVSPSFLKCMDEALMIASTELDSIIQDGIQNKEKIQETMNNTLQVMQNLTSSKNKINSGDLSSSLDILEKIVNVTNSTQSIIEKKVFYAVVDNVLSSNNTRSWSIVSKESEKDASSLLKTMERLSDIIIKNHNITTTQFSGSNFELKIDKTNIDQREIRFPDPTSMNLSRNLEDPSTFLELPKQGGHAEKAINYVAVIYKTMSDILSSDFHRNVNENEEKASPKTIEYVNSAVLSLTTQADFGELDPPLNLTFKHVNQIESKRMQVICVSWDFAISKWTERGCKMKQSDYSTTKCQCNHLTNFAILMRPYSANVKDKQSLKTMSLGGVIISILFTVMTLIIYVRIWRYIKSDQNIIMLHLCSSLILSYIIFLSAVEWAENENMCIAITAIIHYLFLVTFFSMLGMGVYYFMSITVTYYAMYVANNFKSKSRVRWFLLVIWGFPAVITVTNVGAFWGKDYHLRFYCWLSMESGSLYMFIIPVCLIVVLNIAIIVTLVRVLCASSAISKSSLQKKATSGLRSLGTLLPVLGVTWLFGILAVNEHVDVFQYIFVIANSCQGLFIFISHVVLNKKVMQALRHEYPAFSAFKSITEESKKETTTVATSQLTSNLGSKSLKVKRKGIIERIRALKRGKNKVKDSEVIVLDETLSTDCSTSLSHEKSFKVSENEPTINTLELESAREITGRRFQFSFNLNPWKKKYTITEM